MNTDFFDNVTRLIGVLPTYRQEIEIVKANIALASRVFLVGNGGSNAIAEHIATDLMKRCGKMAFTVSNTSLLTCYANDYKYENVFVEFLKAHQFGIYHDVCILISSSGRSNNILNVLDYYRDKFGLLIVICGFKGLPDAYINDVVYLKLNSYNYGEVEIVSELILHSIVEELVDEKIQKETGSS